MIQKLTDDLLPRVRQALADMQVNYEACDCSDDLDERLAAGIASAMEILQHHVPGLGSPKNLITSDKAEYAPEQKGNQCYFCESDYDLSYIMLTIDSNTTRLLWLCPRHLKGVLRYSAKLASEHDWGID